MDREDILGTFRQYLTEPGTARLLVLTGVGGIGKSRLLHELGRCAGTSGPDQRRIPYALLNLQEPAQRSQISALASLRTQYGDSRVRFDRFDVAYAVWWQRLNPHVALTVERLPFAHTSEVIATVLGEVSELPVFGSAVRVMEILARRYKRSKAIRHEPTLRELDELPHDQLGDAVTYLFARDLNAHGDYVLGVDAYEALVGGVSRVGRASFSDAWLRDLVLQLDRGLVAVASREPLGWEQRDPHWGQRIEELNVDGLPFDSRLELLAGLGVSDAEEARSIAFECDGVPYYLHLAREAGSTRGAFAQIEERFLYHVEPALVRILELLSVARVFDYEIFKQIADHFGVLSDILTWEALIGHSFVLSAGPDSLQLHQLMAQAIRSRLSEEAQQELHSVLHGAWRTRVDATLDVKGLREAAYHAARTRQPPLLTLVAYADQASALEGKLGLDTLRTDLPDMPRLQQLWMAESALLVGDAAAALTALPAVSPELPSDADEVDARLAVAAANAYRILGDTDEALVRYGQVWNRFPGTVALDAGLWYADLHMAQGRFMTAIETATDMAQRCPPERLGTRGDLARLLFLAHRFSFDMDGAAQHLEQAQRYYAEAGHVVGQANAFTNRVELLALTDPAAAVGAAGNAVAAQKRLGADHEVGKTYTALALAQLTLGELPQAKQALDRAEAALEQSGYRSGRARAELVRAMWHARSGQPELARDSVKWAITELEATTVYPTLVLAAAELLDRIGTPDPKVTAAAERATRQIQPLRGMPQLRQAIRDMVRRVIGDQWDTTYATAIATSDELSGFYHRNVRVKRYLVRVPLPAAERMDLHIWPEPAVLAAIRPYVPSAPRLRAVSNNPPYQIHDWIDGVVLDAVAPKGTPVPEGVVQECAALFGALSTVPETRLPPVPPDWPDGDSVAFAQRLLSWTRSVHSRFASTYGALWRDLGIPAEPFAPLSLHRLRPRPFRLVHSDVHRKNIIIQHTDSREIGSPRCHFLDWELALYGDPVYDLSVHLHKMMYQPDDEEAFLQAWQQACDADRWPGWQHDLHCYRDHEKVKSVIVDSVRYAQELVATSERLEERLVSLVDKLIAARRVWADPTPVSPDQVRAALTRFG